MNVEIECKLQTEGNAVLLTLCIRVQEAIDPAAMPCVISGTVLRRPIRADDLMLEARLVSTDANKIWLNGNRSVYRLTDFNQESRVFSAGRD